MIKQLLTGAALAFSLTGCYEADIPCSVVLIGDSVMQETSGVLGFHLLRRNNAPMLINNSMGGMTTVAAGAEVYWAERLTRIQEEVDVKYVFASLGINDISFYGQRPEGVNELWEAMPSALDKIMSSVAPSIEVYWLVPHLCLENSRLSGPEVQVVRQQLAEAAERWDNLYLIYIDDNPEWIDSDLIHLNALGEKQVALKFISNIGEQR